ncbi:MAG: glycosyltransferase [Alphaproteobacteria bacterium]
MNDALKLLSKSLKPFGYHIRKFNTPNLLKLNAVETPENMQNVKSLRLSIDHPHITKDANTNHMIIYMRTCIRANRNIDKTARITGVTLEEHTLRCLNSLLKSISHAQNHMTGKTIELIVLDDRSDAEPLNKIKALVETATCPHTIKTTKETGQGNSLHQQFKDSSTQNALLYFCEDDYLHEEDAIKTCWEFYDKIMHDMGTHSFIYPQEHPVIYDNLYPSYIVLGSDRHWRTIRNATHTFITHGHIVRDFWDYFENTKYVGVKKKRKLGSEARTTNKLFKHIPAFSPLKPAAVHLQFEETVPPLYDWKNLWESNKI